MRYSTRVQNPTATLPDGPTGDVHHVHDSMESQERKFRLQILFTYTLAHGAR